MIRRATREDLPAIRNLMDAEPGFWQPDWSDATLASAIESAELTLRGRTILIADVWRDAEPFYRSLGWELPDAVLLRRRLGRGACAVGTK